MESERRKSLCQPMDAKMSRSVVESYFNPVASIKVMAEMLPNQVMDKYKLTLSSVIIATRHGDRGPIKSIRMMDRINCDPFEAKSQPLGQKQSVPVDPFNGIPFTPGLVSLFKRYDKVSQKMQNNLSHLYQLTPTSDLRVSQLTIIGVLQHLVLGQTMRKAYARRLGLSVMPFDKIKAYSTPRERTFQSAFAFLVGLLDPTSSLDIDAFPEIYLLRDIYFSSSVSSYSTECENQKASDQERHQDKRQSDPQLLEIKELIGKMRTSFGLLTDENNPMSTGAIFDALMVYLCHGSDLPSGIGEAGNYCPSVEDVNRFLAFEAQKLKKMSKKRTFVRRNWLKTENFLNQLLDHIRDLTDDPSAPKLILYSGHDTTLMAIASVLGFDEGHLPPYASRLVFEVYLQKGYSRNVPSTQFIRIIYNGKDVTGSTDLFRSNQCYSFKSSPSVGRTHLIPVRNLEKHVVNRLREIKRS